MAKAKSRATRTHPDVEYHVESFHGGTEVFKSFRDAAEQVVALCVSRGEAMLDVVIWSEKGARFYGGDDAIEQYREDPEASVFEWFEFTGNMLGRVP